jgi:hypothetical protein
VTRQCTKANLQHAHQVKNRRIIQICRKAIPIRYDATEFAPGGVTEVLAYGTAVKLAEPTRPPAALEAVS